MKYMVSSILMLAYDLVNSNISNDLVNIYVACLCINEI